MKGHDAHSSGFNLSAWALNHPALTRYLMLVLLVAVRSRPAPARRRRLLLRLAKF